MKQDTIFEDAYIIDLSVCNNRFDNLCNIYTLDNIDDTNSDLNTKIKDLLVIAIIDEQLAELNYLISYNLSRSEGKSDFDPEFEQHENDEREHKYKLIERLRELDSDIIFTAIEKWQELNSRGTDWKQETLVDSGEILKNRLKEEEEAVEFYTLATNFLRATSDTTTYTLFKQIKEDEEEHVKDLRDLAREYDLI